jgi:predicted enzyme related to lactoylglutathione lyase
MSDMTDHARSGSDRNPHTKGKHTMNWKLELVPIPVSDVDRAKAFYTEKVGFNADHDTRVSDEMRVVQLTPPGSACSIAIGTGIVETQPGSVQGLHLVVPDIEAARAELVEREVEVGEVQDLGGGSCTSPSAIRMGTAGPCSSCITSSLRHRQQSRRPATLRSPERR